MQEATDKNLNEKEWPDAGIAAVFLSCARLCEFKKCCKKYKHGKRCKKCPKKEDHK